MIDFLKRSWQWLVVLVALVIVGLVLLPRRWVPTWGPGSPGLARAFLREYFWTLVLLLGLVIGMVIVMAYLVRTLRVLIQPTVAAEAPPGAGGDRFPEVDAAWDEILIRLEQARINLSRQNLFLVIAPHEDWSAALVDAAGLRLFAQAPAAAAPIHAYATAEGVLLSCAGASALEAQSAEGIARMEYLCRLVLGVQPDCPIVRGVVVLFPIAWISEPESVKMAAAVRDDLQAIQRVLKLRCPVFAVVSQMETVAGFREFLTRMPESIRHNRCGFAIPGTQVFSGELINRGMVWMSGWFHGWILNLTSEDLFNRAGNNQLFCLDHEVRRMRKRLRSVLEAAFSTHADAEPVLFRGCYFAATGSRATDDQAFAAGLFRGPRSRILADHDVTTWTAEAAADDRRYRRLALGVGLGGGLLSLGAWFYIVAQNPWWWIALLAVVVVWIIAAIRWILG